MRALKKIRRIFFNLLLLLVISIILFIAAALIISSNYEDEIKEYTVKQINEQLKIKINVSEAEVSVLNGFPYISVIFKDVIAWSNPDFNRAAFNEIDTDTLFKSSRVYIQFSLPDLIRHEYNIKRIYASGGKLNLLCDAKGKTNFDLFKHRSTPEQKSFSLELQALRISDFQVSFINLAKKIQSSGYVPDLLFKGKFANKNYSLATIASINLSTFLRDGISYADNYNINTKLILDIRDSLATIKKGEFNLNNLPFEASGSFLIKDKSSLDIKINSRGFNLSTLTSILSSHVKSAELLNVAGRGDLVIKIQGDLSRLEVPAIKAVYLFQFDQISYRDFDLRDLFLKGRFSNGKYRNPASSSINIEKFSLKSHLSAAGGSLNLTNLKSPFVELTLSGNVNAKSLNAFGSNEKIKILSGGVYPDLTLRSQLSSFSNFSLDNIQSAGLSGKLGFEELSLIVQGYPMDVTTGEINFAGESWYPEMIIKTEAGSLGCSMQIDHVMKYLLGKNNGIWINGKIEGRNIDLNHFETKRVRSPEKAGFLFPKNIYFNLSTSVDSLRLKNFASGRIDALLKYQPGFLSIQDIKMNCMHGEISGNGAIFQDSEKNIFLRTQNSLRNVDINILFNSFNNFNQNFLVADNLKGNLSGNIDFSTAMDSSFHVITPTIIAESHLTISSGELNHFEPMKSLSKFIALEELENIRFSAIENSFSIKDEMISIPQMDIQSSAFNVTISGRHGFNKEFEYKLKVNLSEILAGKARKAKKENSEFGIIEPENRRTSLYLSIVGNPGDYKIKYDKKEAVTQIKEDISNEKQSLKKILNEEFGWYKKDSIVNQAGKPQPEKEKFIIVWDEEPEKNAAEKKPKKKSRFKEDEEEDRLRFEWDEENK